MTETAFAHALKKSGVNTNAARLRSIAVEELRKSNRNISRAMEPFVAEVREAGGIMAELVPYATTRHFAYDYLAGVIADMRGEGLKVSAKAGDGVHSQGESHPIAGPVENSKDGGSTFDLTSHGSDGLSSFDPVPAQAGGGVQQRCDSQCADGSPENREGEAFQVGGASQRVAGPSSSHQVGNRAAQKGSDFHRHHGRVVPIPNKPRGLEAMEAQRAGNALMDTYLMLNGAKIGDLVWSSLPRLAKTSAEVSVLSARQSELLKLIHGHVTPADPNTRVRDLIKSADLQRMIHKVEELAHA